MTIWKKKRSNGEMSVYRMDFRSANQWDWFMVVREDWYNGEVVYATPLLGIRRGF